MTAVAPRKSSKTSTSNDSQENLPLEEGRLKALESTLTDLTKRFGEGTVMRLGDAQHLVVEVIPSGSLTIDIASGVGGIARGRVTEIYGPESSGKTTICLHVIAEAQKRGGMAAFVDMEHALDPTYAARIGVDVQSLYVAQPDTAEQALEITEAFVRSGALDVVVLDSVAALVPRVEIEGEMGDSHVGIQARLMSQALRKLAGAIKSSNVSVLFTNQLREKIGVMYGCFHYDTRVALADGRTEKIGKIVNQKLDVEVLSYNTKTGEFEPRRIVNHFNNGQAEAFLQFKVASNHGNGKRSFACTPNHLLLTESGYEHAGDLEVGDNLMTKVPFYLTPLHEQVILGSLLGDGHIGRIKPYSAQFRVTHGAQQNDYCLWKQSLFEGLVGYNGTNVRGGHAFDTMPMYEMRQYADLVYRENGKGGKKITRELLERLTPLAVAIWYMDDGTFDNNRRYRAEIAANSFSYEDRQLLVDWLAEQGIEAKNHTNGRISFGNKEAVQKFHAWIARYVHPSMERKLMEEFRGQFRAIEADPCERLVAVPMPILDIYTKPKTRSMNRFDLEIEGNHSYVVDGVVVHNSPETTSGGRALKFYASMRLDVRKLESLKASGGEVIGTRTRVRVTKNKVAPPFREAEFEIMFGEGGISKTGEILDLATELGLIEKRGAFYRYNDGLLGQGRENSKAFLNENMAIRDELEDAVRTHYGLPALKPRG
ncbi:MAG: recombinase RecA [Anaerolineae bacterium]|nr:recombinase RecA [Anaerolineae bacterium]